MRPLYVGALVAVVLSIPCVGWACETRHEIEVQVPQIDRLQETIDRVLTLDEAVATSAPAGGNTEGQADPVEDLGLPGNVGLVVTAVASVVLLVAGRRLPKWAVLFIRGLVVATWARAQRRRDRK